MILFLFVPVLTFSQSSNWNIQTLGPGTLYDVNFIDSAYGWGVGSSGSIYKTTDGGDGWTLKTSGTTETLWSASFVSRETGYVVGSNKTFLRTTDGGESWAPFSSIDTVDWYRVHFASQDTGWLISYPSPGSIMYTTDGGVTWIDVTPAGSDGFSDVWFLRGTIGWVAGVVEIFRSVDGATWTEATPFIPYLGAISFPHDSIGFLLNPPHIISSTGVGKTTDGGSSWSGISGIDSSSLVDLAFADTGEGWAVGSKIYEGDVFGGVIHHTSDGGLNWIEEVFVDSGRFNRVFSIDKNHCWSVGKLQNTDQMVVAKYNPNMTAIGVMPEIPSGFTLFQNYPNPFNPSTRIHYTLTTRAHIRLSVMNVLGEEVGVLVDAIQGPGRESVSFDASALSSGVYVYRIIAGTFTDMKKMLLLR